MDALQEDVSIYMHIREWLRNPFKIGRDEHLAFMSNGVSCQSAFDSSSVTFMFDISSSYQIF